MNNILPWPIAMLLVSCMISCEVSKTDKVSTGIEEIRLFKNPGYGARECRN